MADIDTNEYLNFIHLYKAYAISSGNKLPSGFQNNWISWWGPLKVDLRALYDVVERYSLLDSGTPLEAVPWDVVGSCISTDSALPLPPESVRKLYCQNFGGFREFVASCNKENASPGTSGSSQHHQQHHHQQRQRPEGQARKQRFMALNDLLQPSPADRKRAAAKPQVAAAKQRSGSGPNRPVPKPKGAGGAAAAAAPARPAGSAAAAAAPARPGVRRSGRTCTQAVKTGYVDSSFIPSDGSDSDSDSDSEPVPLGPAYQAALPELRPRPATGPTAAEAKFLTRHIYTPHSQSHEQQEQQEQQPNPGLALPAGQFHALWAAAGSGPARLQLLEKWLARMDSHMEPHLPQALGLSLLGFKLKATWSPQEEILFALGMLEKYRMFRHMQRHYLRKRSVHELNSHYYNVWKPRAGSVADEYAELCERNGDPVKFRLELCKRLAAIWDVRSMGPIPIPASLPPHIAAKVVPAAAAKAVSTPAGTAAEKERQASLTADEAVAKAQAAAAAASNTSQPSAAAAAARAMKSSSPHPGCSTSSVSAGGSGRQASPASCTAAGGGSRRIVLGGGLLQVSPPVTAANAATAQDGGRHALFSSSRAAVHSPVAANSGCTASSKSSSGEQQQPPARASSKSSSGEQQQQLLQQTSPSHMQAEEQQQRPLLPVPAAQQSAGHTAAGAVADAAKKLQVNSYQAQPGAESSWPCISLLDCDNRSGSAGCKLSGRKRKHGSSSSWDSAAAAEGAGCRPCLLQDEDGVIVID